MLIVTPAALASDMVTFEWQYGLDNNKPVIPLILKSTKLPHSLDARQYIDDFCDIGGFARGYNKLINALDEFGVETDCVVGAISAPGNLGTGFSIHDAEELSKRVHELNIAIHSVFNPYGSQILHTSKKQNDSSRKIEWLQIVRRSIIHHGLFDTILESFYWLESFYHSFCSPTYSKTGNYLETFVKYYRRLREASWVTVTQVDDGVLPELVDILPIDESLLSDLVNAADSAVEHLKNRIQYRVNLLSIPGLIHENLTKSGFKIASISCLHKNSDSFSKPHTIFAVHCGWIRVDWTETPNQIEIDKVERKIQKIMKSSLWYLAGFKDDFC